jgi:hypothetical protein
LDWAFFNRIVGLGVGDVATEAALDAAIGVLESAGCTNYMAQVCSLGQPAQLPEWLAERGFVKSRRMLRSGFELAYLRPNHVHQPAES